MDPQLSPIQIFILSYIAAAVGAVGAVAKQRRDADEHLTWGDALTAVFYYGSAGTTFAMCGYEYLGGKAQAWKIIGASWGIGLGFIKIKELPGYMSKFLSVIDSKENGRRRNGNGNGNGNGNHGGDEAKDYDNPKHDGS